MELRLIAYVLAIFVMRRIASIDSKAHAMKGLAQELHAILSLALGTLVYTVNVDRAASKITSMTGSGAVIDGV
jgi:hypothetical protein